MLMANKVANAPKKGGKKTGKSGTKLSEAKPMWSGR